MAIATFCHMFTTRSRTYLSTNLVSKNFQKEGDQSEEDSQCQDGEGNGHVANSHFLVQGLLGNHLVDMSKERGDGDCVQETSFYKLPSRIF